MTGFVGAANNPMSRLTVASLQDLGYKVDMTKAEAYHLPNLLLLAEGSLIVSTHAHSALVIPHHPDVVA